MSVTGGNVSSSVMVYGMLRISVVVANTVTGIKVVMYDVIMEPSSAFR